MDKDFSEWHKIKLEINNGNRNIYFREQEFGYVQLVQMLALNKMVREKSLLGPFLLLKNTILIPFGQCL